MRPVRRRQRAVLVAVARVPARTARGRRGAGARDLLPDLRKSHVRAAAAQAARRAPAPQARVTPRPARPLRPDPGRREVRTMFGTATVGPRRFGVSWLVAIYLIAGGIVAATHDYWSNLHTWKAVASA